VVHEVELTKHNISNPPPKKAGCFFYDVIRKDMYYNDNTIIYFNGEFLKASEAKTDLYSQSLHYGYAVFEGIRSYSTSNGTRIFKGKEHFERLQYSAEKMQIPFDYSIEELMELSYEVLGRNDFSDAYLRPLVFCSPNMGLTKGRKSYLTIEAWDWTNGYLSNKMRIMTSSYRRPNPDGFHVEAKVSGHYVNSILACQEAKDKGFDEALLLDGNGFVAEGPGANVFFERHGVLYTPRRGNILPGITRATVFEICASLKTPVIEKNFSPKEMYGADAAFYCGTAAEIVEVQSLDNIPFSKDWETTLSAVIQKAFKNLVLEKNFEPEHVYE
jgi:branched-chain amino acid aminotransferase